MGWVGLGWMAVEMRDQGWRTRTGEEEEDGIKSGEESREI